MAAAARGALQSPLLPGGGGLVISADRRRGTGCTALAIAVALLPLAGVLLLLISSGAGPAADRSRSGVSGAHEVESGAGAVAADDGRCSEVGAAVAAALCLGVVQPSCFL